MDELVELQERYRQRALEDIKEVTLLADSYLYLGAISRAYYACLHAIHFLLAGKGIQTKSHKQAHSEFRRQFVKEGQYGKAESRLIDELFKLRQSSDYDPMFEVDEETITDLLQRAQQFVRQICDGA